MEENEPLVHRIAWMGPPGIVLSEKRLIPAVYTPCDSIAKTFPKWQMYGDREHVSDGTGPG